MNYRISSMHKAGFQEFPKTTAEFLEYAKATKRNNTPGGMAFGHASGDATFHQAAAIEHAHGRFLRGGLCQPLSRCHIEQMHERQIGFEPDLVARVEAVAFSEHRGDVVAADLGRNL